MAIVGLFVLAGAWSSPSMASSNKQPRGLFVLTENGPLPDSVFHTPFVKGISLRAKWTDIESQEGSFDWSFFDDHIRRAKNAGLKVMLRVTAGDSTPAWVFAAGAQAFEYRNANRFRGAGKSLTIPVPWDPVFLAKWKNLIQAMGKRYGDSDSVVLIQMAGPGIQGEMHLPKTPADLRHWRELGYSPDKLIGAWKQTIDAFSQAFPNTPLALDVAVPIRKDDGVVDVVISDAESALGGRFAVQHNGLSANMQPGWAQHAWVVNAKGKAITGYQLLCPVNPEGRLNNNGRRFGGTLKAAFDAGAVASPSYIEIYQLDLNFPDTARDLAGEAQRLSN